MNHVAPEDKAKITGLISLLIPNAKIILFGSRARGTHSPRSDKDIAVDAGQPLPRLIIDEAKSMLAPRAILRAALDTTLINEKEYNILLECVTDRNLTSHTSREALAQELLERMPLHYKIMSTILERIKVK